MDMLAAGYGTWDAAYGLSSRVKYSEVVIASPHYCSRLDIRKWKPEFTLWKVASRFGSNRSSSESSVKPSFRICT